LISTQKLSKFHPCRQKTIVSPSPFYEFNSRQFLSGVTAFLKTRERAKYIYAYYLGVTKRGIVHFRTNSATTPGLYWRQRLELLDLNEAMRLQSRDKLMTNVDVVNLSVFGDIKFHCDCPAFKYYGFQYMATELDYALVPESRPPTIRNPNLEGCVCKHLYQVLQRLPMHITVIARDMVSNGLLNKLPSRRSRAITDM